MARVKNPLNSAEASGLVGGLEYRTTRNGAVVGRRSISPQRHTQARNLTHYGLKLAHRTWDALSAHLKTEWERYVDDPRDARQYFVGAFTRLYASGYTMSGTPGTFAATPYPASITVSGWSASLLRASIVWSTITAGQYRAIVRAYCTFRRMSNPDLTKFRLVRSFDWTTTGGYIYLPHLAPYVLILVQCVHKSTGQLMWQRLIDGDPTWDAGPGDLMGMAPDLPDDISGPPPEDEPA